MSNQKNHPLVSVFMPTFNQDHLVVEAIESVLAQDYENWELIIGDDCSSDNTYSIIKTYQQKYPTKIKPFQNAKNLGITKNFNKILSKCTGKYVAFFAGDDIYLPTKLSSQVALMESKRNCILSYHDIEVFDSDSKKLIKYWNSGELGAPPITGDSKKVAMALVKDGTKFMAALSVMVKRDCFPDWGHDERIPVGSDWLLWIEICANSIGRIEFLNGVYAKYRKHSGSVTNNPKKYEEDIYVTLAIVESRYRFLTKYSQKRRARLYYRRAIQEINFGNYTTARSLLREYLRHTGLKLKIIRWWITSYYRQFKSSI